MKSTILALIVCMGIVGCKSGSGGTSDLLGISLSPNIGYLVPGTSDYGCYDGAIAEPRVAFTVVTTEWKYTSSNFVPIVLKLRFENNSFIDDYTYSLTDGKATLATFLSGGAQKSELPSGTYASTCPFAIGGVPIKYSYQTKKFTTSAKAELVGLYTDASDGVVKPVKAQSTVTVVYEP